MVLQRDQVVPVWGWSQPGDLVTVEFAGQTKNATVDSTGHWQVTLDPMPVSSQSRSLTVYSVASRQPVAFQDILVGDVWLCSGQSNMQWPVELSTNGTAEVAAADYPCLRLFQVPQVAKIGPQTEKIDAAWKVCSPATVKTFAATAYFFGRDIWRATGIPLGLIASTWGGTRIEPWLSREALLSDPDSGPNVARIDAGLATLAAQSEGAKATAVRDEWGHKPERTDPGNLGFGAGWAGLNLDDSQWPVINLPTPWQLAGHSCSGVFWFRREINLPAVCVGKELILHLGACDKADTTYFNGVQVGAIGPETKDYWKVSRVYRVPSHLVQAGRNLVATRVFSNFFQGGMMGPAESMQLVSGSTVLGSLAGPWRYQIEHDFGYVEPPLPADPETGAGNPNTPHILFDSMITPLVPAAIRGVLWYQGESNILRARHYRQLFPLLIRDWRRTFGQAELPFYFVQIANYDAAPGAPVQNGYAELREAQMLALREPQTGMAVAIDIGDANDVHPTNKQAVGDRLARHALAKVYGHDLICNGPLYRSHCVEGNAIRIEFDHAVGLKTNDGQPVRCFAIAGRDKKFEWADARIEGTAIVVQSQLVPDPIVVRYAWANNPPVNLYNGVDLPAAPFRTDPD